MIPKHQSMPGAQADLAFLRCRVRPGLHVLRFRKFDSGTDCGRPKPKKCPSLHHRRLLAEPPMKPCRPSLPSSPK